jgi:hypothetical protein
MDWVTTRWGDSSETTFAQRGEGTVDRIILGIWPLRPLTFRPKSVSLPQGV